MLKSKPSQGSSYILLLFRYKFNKFNKTEARTLDFFLSYDTKAFCGGHAKLKFVQYIYNAVT